MPSEPLVIVDTHRRDGGGGVCTIAMNRPDARNALDSALQTALADALHDADGDDDVAAVVLTGTDPAFCAGLDLRELAETGRNLVGTATERPGNPFGALAGMGTPVVGAVNGPAVTGGLELALNCDFLVASDRARFADTHARVGALPGGGMTGLLPEAVGIRKAREMSFTGNFVDAEEALRIGLVNLVVPHERLADEALRIAHDIAGNDQRVVRRLKRNYRLAARGTLEEALRLELDEFKAWSVDRDEVGRRREAILERGRSQTGPGAS